MVEVEDSIFLGRDRHTRPEFRKFMLMTVNKLRNKLCLTNRDTQALGYETYSNDRTLGRISNIMLHCMEQFVLIHNIKAKLETIYSFPHETDQFELISMDGIPCSTKVRIRARTPRACKTLQPVVYCR